MFNDLIKYIYIIPAALISIVLHELGHGLVSYWLGDPTPKSQGRLTLNPLKHLDPIGTLCLIIFGFGWARPVMINSYYYKKPKIGITLTGLAGPLVNFILAILSFIMIGLLYGISVKCGFNNFLSICINFFMYLAIINIGLGVFNLIPIPPLDGSKIIGIFIPEKAYDGYMRYQSYGIYFMISLMVILSAFDIAGLTSPIGWVVEHIYSFFMNVILRIVNSIL